MGFWKVLSVACLFLCGSCFYFSANQRVLNEFTRFLEKGDFDSALGLCHNAIIIESDRGKAIVFKSFPEHTLPPDASRGLDSVAFWPAQIYSDQAHLLGNLLKKGKDLSGYPLSLPEEVEAPKDWQAYVTENGAKVGFVKIDGKTKIWLIYIKS